MTRVLLATTLLSVSAVLGFPIGRRLGGRVAPRIERLLPENPASGVMRLLPFWIAISAASNAGGFMYVPESIRFAVSLIVSYYPLFAYLHLRAPATDAGNRITIVVVAGLCTLFGFYSGMTEAVVSPIVLVGLLAVAVWHRIPWRSALLSAALIVVLQPAKHVYRSLAWPDPNLGVGEAAEYWSTSLSSVWGEGSDKLQLTKAVMGRIDELSIIGTTMELTPTPIPFDYGRQWKYILIAPIPRVFNPDKPNLSEVFNDRFNITFGIQTEDAVHGATMGFPLVADGYWNFGWPGVALVGVIMGLLLGFLSGGLPVGSWGGLAIGSAALMQLHATSHLAHQLGGQVQTFVGVGLGCWAVWFISGGAGSRRRARATG
jgi:hypothetical protein